MDHRNRFCTVESANRSFCNAPSMPDVPFPICAKHAVKLYQRMRDLLLDAVSDPERMREAVEQARLDGYDNAMLHARPAPRKGDPRVYYLRLGGAIKIGTSRFLANRLATYPPGAELLATEPGSFELEQARHRQFEHARLHNTHANSEWFQPTPALLAHIAELRQTAA